MNKKSLSEQDICTKFITPALKRAGWDIHTQVREEVTFTDGRIVVRGRLHSRGRRRRADYLLSYRKHHPVAVIEAKDNTHRVGDGMQQALGYADALDVPFAFSSNGDGFLFHDRTGLAKPVEAERPLDGFPSPEALWDRYCRWKGLDASATEVVASPYHDDGMGRKPRYYQVATINMGTAADFIGGYKFINYSI